MSEEGELAVHGAGELTDVSGFVAWLVAELSGHKVAGIGSDRYRQKEIDQVLNDAGVKWPRAYRGTGASKSADGSHDLRAFQNAALSGAVAVRKSTLWREALSRSVVRTDTAGNPALDKSSGKARIDVLQAGVIACGMASLRPKKRKIRWSA